MAKTGHPNFDYTCQGPWRGATHSFHITGNHSGTSFGSSDAQAFMEGSTSPYALSFAPFQSPTIVVVQSRYYDGQNSAPVYEKTYTTENPAPGPLTATGLGVSSAPGTGVLPLEICVMIEAPCGFSSTSKPIYLRKYIRGAPIDGMAEGTGDAAAFQITTAGTAAAAAMGNGDWYQGRIYISPSARQASQTFQALSVPYNHQVPRGRKRSAAAKSASALSQIEKVLLQTAGVPVGILP